MVKSILSHHLYNGAVTVEGVGEGDYCGQVCFKSPYHGTVTIEDVGESPLLLSNDVLLSFMKYDINNELKKMTMV